MGGAQGFPPLEKEQNIFVSVDHLQDNYLGVLGEHALLWVCVYTAYCIKLQVPRAVCTY